MSMSLRQTQRITLSLSQKAVLKGFESVLKERIHGPDLIVKRNPNAGKSGISGLEFLSASGSAYVTLLSKEGLDEKVLSLHSQTTAASLYMNDLNTYINIIHYYKTLANAFASNGRVFKNAALENWQTNVIEFLGVLPDSWIGKIVGKTASAIGAYRTMIGIKSCRKNLVELEDDEDIFQSEILKIQAKNLDKLRNFQETHSGEDFTDTVRVEINDFIAKNHDKMNDGQMNVELFGMGISISRRTITKYRHQLFPPTIKVKPA